METAMVDVVNIYNTVIQLPLNEIRPNPFQPRKVFDNDALNELALSIKQYGVMQPISVRKIGGMYELIAGERRLRASFIAGKTTIPAIVTEICDKDSAFLAIMENLQRENLHFMEEAYGYLNLMRDYNMTQEEVATKLGKSQSSIANKIRLLRLPEKVKCRIFDNGLTERHTRALLKLNNEIIQHKVLDKVIKDKLNVQKTEQLIDTYINKEASKGKSNGIKYYVKDSRIFVNTIKKAVNLISQSGGEAKYTVKENDDTVEIVVVIQKKR